MSNPTRQEVLDYMESWMKEEATSPTGVVTAFDYDAMVCRGLASASAAQGMFPNASVTAGELRGLRVNIPAEVPDCAWVPRSALSFGEPVTTLGEEMRMHTEIPITVDAPFRWEKLEEEAQEQRR